jgi:hypothetical protein
MRLVTLCLLVAACGPKGGGAAGGNGTTPLEPGRKSVADHLAAVEAYACDGQTPPRIWCVAAKGWGSAAPAAAPADGLWAGVAVGLVDEEPAEEMIETNVAFTALGIQGGKARIVDLQPRDAAESEALSVAIGELAAVFKGKQARAKLDPDLLEYLRKLPPIADRTLVKGERGWTLEGASVPTELRKVGDWWVAVMVIQQEPYGIYLAVFTDRIE